MPSLLINILSFLCVLAVLFLQNLVNQYLGLFNPDLVFLSIILLVLVYRKMGFVSLAFSCIFIDVFAGNAFGSSILSFALCLYLMELTGFHYSRLSFLSSSIFITVFFSFYVVGYYIFHLGINNLFSNSILYLLFHIAATTLVWMLIWKIQARHENRLS